MKVYFMRHGETDWNAEQRLQGSTDIPLNEKGIALAQVTAKGAEEEGIRFDYCFSSPLIRAYKTAEIMTEASKITPVTDDRIKEICFGDYEGKRIKDLREGEYKDAMAPFFIDTANYVAQNGAEDLDHLFARLKEFFEEKVLPLEGKCDHVLVCCHGAVCRAFMVLLKPLTVAEYWADHQFNCSMNVVEITNGQAKVIEENKIYYDAEEQIKNPLLH